MGYSGYVYVNKDLILQLVACEIVFLLILKRQEEVLSTTLLFLAEIFVSTNVFSFPFVCANFRQSILDHKVTRTSFFLQTSVIFH